MRTRMEQLYPICRSITGDGVRRTLDVIGEALPPGLPWSGTRCLGDAAHDWTVNDEWNVRDAWIADASGRRLVDFREHNLHLVGYSVPVRARMTLDELRPHLHTLPEHPDWIPYRTTYYHRTWGFCLTQQQLEAMGEGPFDVVVDTTLEPGELTYGELLVPGRHRRGGPLHRPRLPPSLANDNLSGIVVAAELARRWRRSRAGASPTGSSSRRGPSARSPG